MGNLSSSEGHQQNYYSMSEIQVTQDQKDVLDRYKRYFYSICLSENEFGKGIVFSGAGNKLLILTCLHCCASVKRLSECKVEKISQYEQLSVRQQINKSNRSAAKIYSQHKQYDLALLIADRPAFQSFSQIPVICCQPDIPAPATPNIAMQCSTQFIYRRAQIKDDPQSSARYYLYEIPNKDSTSTGMSGSGCFEIGRGLVAVHYATNRGIALDYQVYHWMRGLKDKLIKEEDKQQFERTPSRIVQMMYDTNKELMLAEIGIDQLGQATSIQSPNSFLRNDQKQQHILKVFNELIKNGDQHHIRRVSLQNRDLTAESCKLLINFKSIVRVNVNQNKINKQGLQLILKLPNLEQFHVVNNLFSGYQCLSAITTVYRQNFRDKTQFMKKISYAKFDEDLIWHETAIKQHTIMYKICFSMPMLERISIGYKSQTMNSIVKGQFLSKIGQRSLRIHTQLCMNKKITQFKEIEQDFEKLSVLVKLEPRNSLQDYQYKRQQYKQLLLQITQSQVLWLMAKTQDIAQPFLRTQFSLQLEHKQALLKFLGSEYQKQGQDPALTCYCNTI